MTSSGCCGLERRAAPASADRIRHPAPPDHRARNSGSRAARAARAARRPAPPRLPRSRAGSARSGARRSALRCAPRVERAALLILQPPCRRSFRLRAVNDQLIEGLRRRTRPGQHREQRQPAEVLRIHGSASKVPGRLRLAALEHRAAARHRACGRSRSGRARSPRRPAPGAASAAAKRSRLRARRAAARRSGARISGGQSTTGGSAAAAPGHAVVRGCGLGHCPQRRGRADLRCVGEVSGGGRGVGGAPQRARRRRVGQALRPPRCCGGARSGSGSVSSMAAQHRHRRQPQAPRRRTRSRAARAPACGRADISGRISRGSWRPRGAPSPRRSRGAGRSVALLARRLARAAALPDGERCDEQHPEAATESSAARRHDGRHLRFRPPPGARPHRRRPPPGATRPARSW